MLQTGRSTSVGSCHFPSANRADPDQEALKGNSG